RSLRARRLRAIPRRILPTRSARRKQRARADWRRRTRRPRRRSRRAWCAVRSSRRCTCRLRQRGSVGARHMKLLVDLGNTRLKWAFWDGKQLRFAGAAQHAELVDLAWNDFPQADSVWVASVAAAQLNERIEQSARARFGFLPRFVRSRA